jgi:hypothetical protein
LTKAFGISRTLYARLELVTMRKHCELHLLNAVIGLTQPFERRGGHRHWRGPDRIRDDCNPAVSGPAVPAVRRSCDGPRAVITDSGKLDGELRLDIDTEPRQPLGNRSVRREAKENSAMQDMTTVEVKAYVPSKDFQH